MSAVRLAIVSTHPIQYYAPIFQALAKSRSVRPRVFFTWSQTADATVIDQGFGRAIQWDIPLLEGYEFEFVPNTASRPGSHHFRGLRNPGLNRAIETWGADAVLVFGWNLESHLRALLHFKKKLPVFFRGDSTLLDSMPGWRAVARRIVLSWVYRHVDVAIAVGSNNRDYYRWCGLRDERIAFAPHAIDTRRFADPDGAGSKLAARWRNELGIAPEARIALFAGKLQPKKDPALLLEAFTRAAAPGGHLVFVGDGPMEAELRARAQGRSDVHFLPFQNQQAMPAVYRLADVFVLPSRGPGETWGLAINEAMASRRAVIASTKVGGARDMVRHGVNGWVFEAGNSTQLAGALREALACERETLRGIAEAAERDSAQWSIEAAATGIERAVAQFAGKAG
jgi:glycosyltransferase involved in cell wall biosynthesis